MCIRATRRFLNALLDLPEIVSTKLPDVIEAIQNGHRQGSCKIKNGEFYRIRITIKYRLFYRYDNGCIDLLDIPRRTECTYKGVGDLLDKPLFEFEDENQTDSHQEFLLSKKQLLRWNIPEEYDRYFLELRNEEELVNLIDKHPEINWKHISKIIDILDRKLEDVSKETYYEIDSPDSLVDFYQAGETTKFLLALSDEQKRILDLGYEKAILVKGGPGTGKSILALHRVKRLVEDRKVKKILLTTHNDTLVDYFKQLLEELVPKALESNTVHVRTVDDIVKEYAEKNAAKNQATIASREISSLCLKSVMETIRFGNSQNRLKHLSESSILQEILGTIESKGISSLEIYQDTSKFAQGENHRRDLLKCIWFVYEEWEKILYKSGYATIEQSRRKALDAVVKEDYDAVVIDEAQDLSPTALRLLVKLGDPSKLFVTADTSQSLYERSFAWNFIQGQIKCEFTEKTLRKSFRNTQEIGKACLDILTATESGNSVFSSLLGNKPKIILTDDLLERLETVINFFKAAAKEWKLPISAGAILVPNQMLGLFIANQLTHAGFAAKWLDRQISAPNRESFIKVLSLHAAKGLEFPFVAIIGLEENILPRSLSDVQKEDREEILNQERRLFYVGCSRAMRSLLVCGSKSNPSQFIGKLQAQINQNIDSAYWDIE
jgi:superfamily I DNA/RNA helicase